jgi:hypothetical protein
MGYLRASEMAHLAPLDTALRWHLQHNHYPPVPASMVSVCRRAIKAAKAGDTERRLRLPKGVTWKGERTAPVWAVIEGHHLEAFL